MKKWVLFMVSAILLMAIVASCGPSTTAPTTTAPTTGAPKPTAAPTTTAPTTAPTAKPTAAPAKAIVLTATTPWAKTYALNDAFLKWVDYVNANSAGKVDIQYRGGPETIASADQMDANIKDIIDVSLSVGTYHSGIIPEAEFPKLTPWPSPANVDIIEKERANGFDQLMKDIYATKGIYRFGRGVAFQPIYLFTDKAINKIADIKGLKIRTTPPYNPVIQTLGGGIPVSMTTDEIYTGLQQRLINGYVTGMTSVRSYGYQKFTQFCTPEPFFENDASVVMNMAKYQSLPDDVKKLLNDSWIMAEKEYVTKYFQQSMNTELAALKESGMKFIDLSADEHKLFQDTLNQGQWAKMEKVAKPEFLNRLKDIVKKAGGTVPAPAPAK